jgi:hypothetical protein
MRKTKRDLIRKTMYRLADAKEPLDYETVELLKELGKAYVIDVYDMTGMVDGERVVVGTGIEDDWYLNKGFAQTDECDIFRRV